MPKASSACGRLGAAEDPLELRRREVRIADEPRPLAHEVGRQLARNVRRAAVLPDDRALDRTAGPALPDDRRLALVRDSDRRELARPDPGVRESRLGGERATLAQISSGSCSTQPGSGKYCAISR